MSLKDRVARLEAAGRSGTCPRCGRPADPDELHRREPHSPESKAEYRRLTALPPEEFREEYKAAFGFYPGEDPSPKPDDEVFQPECWRCGSPTRPPMTYGQMRALPHEELMALMKEEFWA